MIDPSLLSRLTEPERARLDALLASQRRTWTPQDGPQLRAYESQADIVGYGGAAGGGKSDLLCGLALTQHRRALIIRREKAQTLGLVQRFEEVIGNRDGYNSQSGSWRVGKRIVEFGGLDNDGDERRWQGRPHDLLGIDEVTECRESQVRFLLGWVRSADQNQRVRVVLTFNPPTSVEGRWVLNFFGPWLDEKHPNPAMPGELRWYTTINGKDREVDGPAPFVLEGDRLVYQFQPRDYAPEQIIHPKSRTFIPARVTDNAFYMATDYISQLQALPEPLRSQMLKGDFAAGIQDDPWQVIPTEWVKIAQKRWKRPDVMPPMDAIGVDVARGGKDKTCIARRHEGWWFDDVVTLPGTETPQGNEVVGQVMKHRKDKAPIFIDGIGVGASPYDMLRDDGQQIYSVIVSDAAHAMDKTGTMRFLNRRSELIWRMREALDPDANNGIALPPDPELLADLCSFTWVVSGRTIKVAGRDEIQAKIGRSPDKGSALMLAMIEMAKWAVVARFGQPTKHVPHNPLNWNKRRDTAKRYGSGGNQA